MKWEWWIFVSCYLQSCFFFSPLSSCFSDTLLPLIPLPKSKIKSGTSHTACVTRKLIWKFDIRESWLVIFLVREQCQRTRPHPPSPRFPACTTLFLPNISGRMDTKALSTTIRIFWKPHILYTQKIYQRIIICTQNLKTFDFIFIIYKIHSFFIFISKSNYDARRTTDLFQNCGRLT